MVNSILANIIAGLGLFFSGLRMVDANLRQAAGRQLRAVIGTLTERHAVAGLVGVMVGALIQSSSGIVFIMVSLVSSGLTTVRRALPIITWANVGCCALIFIAVLDLRLAILYLLGLAGGAFAFQKSHKSDALGAIFGIGMLFYGMELMKAGAEPLRTMPWFPDMMQESRESYALAFIGGTAFSFVTQSSTAVSILVIGFAQTGIIGPFPTMMGLYGANLGSTFSRMLLSTRLKGSVRQLTAYQDLFKITGTLIFVPLLYLEAVEGVPMVRALVATISDRIDRQMALVFLIFNLVTAVLFTLCRPLLITLLERWLPGDLSDDAARPRYLYDEALNEPSTALDLISKEQLRLATRLTGYTAAMRTDVGSPQREQVESGHEPFATVARAIERFQLELLNQALGGAETNRLNRLQSRLNLLVYLEEGLRTLIAGTGQVVPGSALAARVSTFVEALDFVLITLVDALGSGDGNDIDLLQTITEDRGEFVERLRQEFLSNDQGSAPGDRAVLLQVTNVFERIIWMTQRFAGLLDRAPDHEGVSPQPVESPVVVMRGSNAPPPVE